MKNSIILLAFLSVFLGGCDAGGDQKSPASEEKILTEKVLTEDQIILQLSAFVVADPQTQGEVDQNAIVDYAMEQLIPLKRTPTGLFYYVQKAGEGPLLNWGDYIKVDYQGYFLDGKLFDDTRRRNKPLQFYIGNMIQGWNEGLQHVAPGGRILLAVPSPLAYSTDGLPDGKGGLLVPGDTPLIFEVEVLEKLPAPN